ncbi:hypothetical protein C7M84_015098 [Penaeus vannamei]|uniref:Uncharacterized protein n=1 Tax=Penaeus vannamei TaxID=6689 RepID=A0A3R7PCR2_PENVA|nr:hypothetical protein C7M84_015098 [Penaeus vannamei]
MKQQVFLCLLLVYTAYGNLFGSKDDSNLILKSTGPVVLDMPIWFTAEYLGYEDGDELMWEWTDSLYWSTTHYVNAKTDNWTITCDHERYSPYTGERTVEVKVKEKVVGLIWMTKATARINFNLTVSLNGRITVVQPNVTMLDPKYISTTNQTNLTAVIHDPHNWLKKRTNMITYFWIIDDKVHASCSTPSLVINITEPVPNQRSWKCDGYWPEGGQAGYESSTFKLGYFHTYVSAREPIDQVNVTGKKWLKHGELLNLTIQCSGSGPWGYCHKVFYGTYNITGTLTNGAERVNRPRARALAMTDLPHISGWMLPRRVSPAKINDEPFAGLGCYVLPAAEYASRATTSCEGKTSLSGKFITSARSRLEPGGFAWTCSPRPDRDDRLSLPPKQAKILEFEVIGPFSRAAACIVTGLARTDLGGATAGLAGSHERLRYARHPQLS